MELKEYLEKYGVITRKPNLEAMQYFMKEFGEPNKKTKFIHIAGTNGKGSICEMLNSILVNAGYKIRKIYFSTSNKI